jgi:Coenzyme PQQ synthesis protein D (PqqD)
MVNDFSVAPGVCETASEDGAVLLDIEQGVCFSLNPVGLRIWELLKAHRSLEQIADILGEEFSVPRAQLVSDATQFIAALEARHLIRRPSHSLPKRPWFARMFSLHKV